MSSQNFLNFGLLTAKNIRTGFSPTLRIFCVFLHCRATHTHLRQQNSIKLCHTIRAKPRQQTAVIFWVLCPAKNDWRHKNCGRFRRLWVQISLAWILINTFGKRLWNYEGFPASSQNFENFGLLTTKIGPEFSPTLWNHHLLCGGGHHVGLPLGVPTFLVNNNWRCSLIAGL